MASIIVKTTLDTAKEFTGKAVSTKVHGRKYQVFFKVEVDDFNIEEAISHASRDKNIIMLDYVGTNDYITRVSDFKGVYIAWGRELGGEIDESDIAHIEDITPEGVTPIIKLPTSYNNIRFLYEMSEKYNRVRFCGGYLYSFDGCRFGCCGRDILSKLNIKFDDEDRVHEGCSCAIPVFEDSMVELVATSKSSRTSNNSESKNKVGKSQRFSSILMGGTVEM